MNKRIKTTKFFERNRTINTIKFNRIQRELIKTTGAKLCIGETTKR